MDLTVFRQTSHISRAATPGQLMDENMPVLYEDIMTTWPSYPKWNIRYLVERFGNRKISADRKVGDQIFYIQMEMADYANYMYETDDANPYYAKSTLHLNNGMDKEYLVPPAFHCWYKEYYTVKRLPRKIPLSSLYIGPRGARSTLHKDIWGTSFWNALYEGRKLWLFFPREQEELLYNGEVDPFAVDIDKYPLFYDTTPIVCIQEPGQLIYCPGNIWHWAYALEPSLALSENFINKENYRYVLDYFHSVGYNNAAQKMEDIARMYLNN